MRQTQSILQLLKRHDPETWSHCLRVARLSAILAEASGWGKEGAKRAWLAGVFHDVGKAYIPISILRKPGSLSARERHIIERHTWLGYQMLRRAGIEEETALAALCHHKRWDGQGYPLGLRGEDIPILARLVAVADVYDTLTSHRPYRPARTHEEAMAIIAAEAGAAFDPVFVRVLERLEDGLPARTCRTT